MKTKLFIRWGRQYKGWREGHVLCRAATQRKQELPVQMGINERTDPRPRRQQGVLAGGTAANSFRPWLGARMIDELSLQVSWRGLGSGQRVAAADARSGDWLGSTCGLARPSWWLRSRGARPTIRNSTCLLGEDSTSDQLRR